MNVSLFFWLIYIICVVFGLWSDWPVGGNLKPLGGRVVIFLLIGILGWAQFGAAVHR